MASIFAFYPPRSRNQIHINRKWCFYICMSALLAVKYGSFGKRGVPEFLRASMLVRY